jgi:hypothetical protein
LWPTSSTRPRGPTSPTARSLDGGASLSASHLSLTRDHAPLRSGPQTSAPPDYTRARGHVHLGPPVRHVLHTMEVSHTNGCTGILGWGAPGISTGSWVGPGIRRYSGARHKPLSTHAKRLTTVPPSRFWKTVGRQRQSRTRLGVGRLGSCLEDCGVTGDTFVANQGGIDHGGVRNLTPDFVVRRAPWNALGTSLSLGKSCLQIYSIVSALRQCLRIRVWNRESSPGHSSVMAPP